MSKTYNFDETIERKGTGDVKNEQLMEFFGREDLLPLWVADMDFATPDFIREALLHRLQHPILGYSVTPKDYWDVIAQWIKEHHGWQTKTEWMAFIPGIVKGIGMVANVFCNPGDKVIIQPPVYHPFRITPEGNGCQIVWNPLKESPDGTYSMDFQNLEEVYDSRCKVLILANPHNPIGICWDRETLQRLASFCAEHQLIVVSDEIHCDLALYGNHHIPFASVSEQAAQWSITFGAPSKTFNMAGVVSSYCIVPNKHIRQRFFSWLAANEFDYPHMFSTIATMAAFKHGEEWRKQLLRYLEGNVDYVMDFCAKSLPQIIPHRPQASFLVWLDCRRLGLTHEGLTDLFVNHARLALNDGAMFGPGGEGFMRLNIASPRSILMEAMQRLKNACESRLSIG